MASERGPAPLGERLRAQGLDSAGRPLPEPPRRVQHVWLEPRPDRSAPGAAAPTTTGSTTAAPTTTARVTTSRTTEDPA